MSDLTLWQARSRRVLAGVLLVTTLVTTCFAGPVGVYLGLVAVLISLVFLFDTEMLARALDDWGVRCFVAAFLLLWAAFMLSAKDGNDAIAFIDFLAFPLVVPAFALLARQAAPQNVALVAVLAGVGCAVAVATGLYEVRILGVERAQGGTSAIFFSNLALLLGFFALLGLFVLRTRWRWLLALCQVFALGAAVQGGTRGSMLAAIAFLAVFAAYALFWWRRPPAERLFTVAVVVTLIGAAVFLGTFDTSRMASIWRMMAEGTATDASASYRLSYYEAAFRAWMDSPVYGHGWWRRFSAAIPYMSPAAAENMAHDNHAHLHNDTLNFASSAGAMGILAYFTLMAAPVVSAWRSPRDEGRSLRVAAASGLTLGYLMMGATDVMFVFETPKTIYCLGAAIVMAFFLHAPPARLQRT